MRHRNMGCTLRVQSLEQRELLAGDLSVPPPEAIPVPAETAAEAFQVSTPEPGATSTAAKAVDATFADRAFAAWSIQSTPRVSDADTPRLPDVPDIGGFQEWNLNAVEAPESWAAGFLGQGVTVAIVDTGVDLDHPDLVSNLWVNPGEIPGNGLDDDLNGFVDDVHGWDFAADDSHPDDRHGHGTHVAGIVAAADNGSGVTGVAPEASIMAVRALGEGGSGSISDIAAGIRYAAANGADVINLSLSGAYGVSVQSAIEYAGHLGSLVVGAAGNSGAAFPSYPARYSAHFGHVLSVGAHDSSGAVASFSSDVGNSGAVQVDAPGVSIYSTYVGGGHAWLSGTSMAAPHVAGLAALALSADQELDGFSVRDLIVDGAVRTVAGSDALGGVTAATTVALAAPWAADPEPGPNFDANRDGVVDLLDFSAFRKAFGTSQSDAEFVSDFDANGDGWIDLFDFAAFRKVFGLLA